MIRMASATAGNRKQHGGSAARGAVATRKPSSYPGASIKLRTDKVWGETTGRDDRIRTCDPHTPSVMRYQAALRPDPVEARAIGKPLQQGKRPRVDVENWL